MASNFENGVLLADAHTILKRWKNYVSQLLNVHRVNDVGQMDMHYNIHDNSHFEAEIVV